MPRRSTGCEKCRQRKVRCDERKPFCRRCAEYGTHCPGYRLPVGQDLRFVDQTEYGAKRSGSRLVASTNCISSPHAHGDRAGRSDMQLRWRNQFSGDILTASATPDHRQLHRVQLLSTFLELYLPKRRDRTMMSHFAYVTAFPLLDLSNPLLQTSIDTLCLVELGSLHGDERCLQEARGRYVRALPMLSHELAKPVSRQLHKDHILTAITVLSLCELFDAIASSIQGGQGWISHVQGAQQYVKAYGPHVIDTPLGWLLFNSVRHSSLCMGLVHRKAVFLSEPKWLRLTKTPALHDPYIALYDRALHVPGLLERADHLSDAENFRDAFTKLARDICRLRESLDAWLRHHHTPAEEARVTVVDLREMEEFAALCPDRTFVTVYSFPFVQVCSQHQLYWVTCLLLDFTLANMYRMHKKARPVPPLPEITARQKDDFKRDMYVNATNYCRTLPYSVEPETSSIGRVGTFLLRIVQSYFRIFDHERESEWCRSVRRMLESSAAPSVSEADQETIEKQKRAFSVACQVPELGVAVKGKYPDSGYIPRLPPPELESFVGSPWSAILANAEGARTDPHASATDQDAPHRPTPKLLSPESLRHYLDASESGSDAGTPNYVFVHERDAATPRERTRRRGGSGVCTLSPSMSDRAEQGDARNLDLRLNGASAVADDRAGLLPFLSPSVVNEGAEATFVQSVLDEEAEATVDEVLDLFGEGGTGVLLPNGTSRTGPIGAMCW